MRYPKVEVKPSTTHGLGLFLKEDVTKNTQLLEYKGLRCTEDEWNTHIKSLPPRNDGHTFLFGLSNGLYIDGSRGRWNNARYANHSCAPNIEAREEGNRIWFYSLKAMKAGTELFLDYQLSSDPDMKVEDLRLYRCFCNAKKCRGTMLGDSSA